MTGLFGKGGMKSDNTGTEPAPLNVENGKVDIKNEIVSPKSSQGVGPYNNNDYSNDGMSDDGFSDRQRSFPDSYQSPDTSSIRKSDTVHDFSDMLTVDQLRDKEIADLRKDGYRLANTEREFDIRHKNDLSNIVKIILICFSTFVGLGFIAIISVITWTSYKTNSVTEKGIISSLLNFIAEIIKIGLS